MGICARRGDIGGLGREFGGVALEGRNCAGGEDLCLKLNFRGGCARRGDMRDLYWGKIWRGIVMEGKFCARGEIWGGGFVLAGGIWWYLCEKGEFLFCA